ncbi:cysteine proteinase [Hesseltinella vesiculosa]|uniref:Cysteine proteinase n=1 Tax=Hesseltinella vesiculosa TaxID=101127 RepID=A0A1X2G8L5_9FUNG|nr:cysteine proteinase [Hesseltinella vesiculosa]
MSGTNHLSSADMPERHIHGQMTIYRMLYTRSNPASFYKEKAIVNTAGCLHLKQHKSNECRPNLTNAYRHLVRYALQWANWHSNPTRRKHPPPNPNCTSCSESLSRLHICLHCVYMGCWKKDHMRQHLKAQNHTLAMDFDRLYLYCADCNDYVYDTEWMEEVVRSERLKLAIGSRRFKLRTYPKVKLPWNSNDADLLTCNSTVIHCQGIRGLCNFGNTCFMNVILQSFLLNPLLKAYFLGNQHSPKLCMVKYCLCCEMDRLFVEVYDERQNDEPYGPRYFLHAMWMSFKELAGYAQQDAHEFFIGALNSIHNSSQDHSLINCKCIVHRTFAGVLQSNVTCSKCGNTTTTNDPMLDISLGLYPSNRRHSDSVTLPSFTSDVMTATTSDESTSSYIKNKFYTPPISRRSKSQTLVDCLDRYTQPEKLGNQGYICNKCSTFQEATKRLSIKKLPPVLCFQLKVSNLLLTNEIRRIMPLFSHFLKKKAI